MPTIRAATNDVLARVRASLTVDAQQAAGNAQLSLAEQKALKDGDTLKAAAADVRNASGRVSVDALVEAAAARVEALLATVNTKGPSAVSIAEVKRLAATDADAGARVAKAYELITGKHIDLDAVTTPATPPPAAGAAFALANLRTAMGGTMGFHADLVGNALVMKGMGGAPLALDVDIGGRAVHVDFAATALSMGGVTGGFQGADVVEALRAQLPADIGLRVASFHLGKISVDFWPKSAVPPVDNAPQYGAVMADGIRFGAEKTGPLAMKMNVVAVAVGDTVSFRVDDKLYVATARNAGANTGALVRDLANQIEADGHTAVFKNYGAVCSLRVTA